MEPLCTPTQYATIVAVAFVVIMTAAAFAMWADNRYAKRQAVKAEDDTAA